MENGDFRAHLERIELGLTQVKAQVLQNQDILADALIHLSRSVDRLSSNLEGDGEIILQAALGKGWLDPKVNKLIIRTLCGVILFQALLLVGLLCGEALGYISQLNH